MSWVVADIAPEVGTSPRWPFHEPPRVVDTKGHQLTLILYFDDEDTADRVAKALIHAVELCGGGNDDPF
jgi:hypothetical protein